MGAWLNFFVLACLHRVRLSTIFGQLMQQRLWPSICIYWKDFQEMAYASTQVGEKVTPHSWDWKPSGTERAHQCCNYLDLGKRGSRRCCRKNQWKQFSLNRGVCGVELVWAIRALSMEQEVALMANPKGELCWKCQLLVMYECVSKSNWGLF